MQAIAAHRGSTQPTFISVEEPPSPKEDEVLCRTLQLGVCGTDREILLSADPWVPHGINHLILGHECLARVRQIGSSVDQFQVGDLVVPVVRRPLNPAELRADLLSIGQYTERGIAHEHGFSLPCWIDRPEHLFPVEEKIASIAVLTEPFSVAEKGINEALLLQKARLGEATWLDIPPRVLVTGMGPIGFSAAASCICRQWPVTMYGRDSEDSFRASLAVSFGVQYLPADQCDFSLKNVDRDGYDLILECTGSDEVLVRTSRLLASRGAMVWLGGSRQPRPKPHNVELMMRNCVLRNHLFVGSVNAASRDFAHALEHLTMLFDNHRSAVEALITARISPEDSLWHYENREPQGIKTVLMYS